MAQSFMQRAKLEAEKGLKKLTNAAEKSAASIRAKDEERKARIRAQRSSIAYEEDNSAAHYTEGQASNLVTAIPDSVSLSLSSHN